MPFRWSIKSIRFSGGEEVSPEAASVLLLIGPNSAGKSTALRDIQSSLQHPAGVRLVVQSVTLESDASADELESWLRESYATTQINGQEHVVTMGSQVQVQVIRNQWSAGGNAGVAFPFLVHRIEGQNRLLMANFAAAIPVFRQAPSAYVHVLQAKSQLAEEISREVHDAFGLDLIIDQLAGSQVGFRIGTKPFSPDPLSRDYDKELNALPKLEDEGDGIRCFVGLLLAAKCGAHPILMIDEPEAFLHPAQARRLAESLARSASRLNRQVILATHSADIVQGALEGGRVAVCRVTREDGKNHAALLESSKLEDLWSKPLLRSVSTISGLFHEGVIVTEAPADARFYDAILRRMVEDSVFERSPSFYFASGSGKGDLARLASAYIKVRTPVCVIADLDLMRNPGEMATVLAALGHSLIDCENLYNGVVSALVELGPSVDAARFSEGLSVVAERVRSSGRVCDEDRRELEPLLRNSADWAEAKRYGLLKLGGQRRAMADEFLERMRNWGLFLVPEGELEGWWRQGPVDKGQWISKAIPKVAEDPAPFQGAIDFMKIVCGRLGAQLRH